MYDNDQNDILEKIPLYPADPTKKSEREFIQDKSNDKIFLGAGELYNENNKTYQFEVVKRAEEKLNCAKMEKNYLPPEGDKDFNRLARHLCFGASDIESHFGKHILTIQTIGATGAVRLGFNFIKKFLNAKLYIPCPSWPLAMLIAKEVEMDYEEVDFFDVQKQELKLDNLLNILTNANYGSILFIQDIANSPTGKDPSLDQWNQILQVVKAKKIRVFFDSAFRGYSSGDFESDSEVVKMFFKAGVQLFVAQTFSKNLGLYGERIGCLHVVCNNADDLERLKSQLEHSVRCLWFSPNLYGARIVKTILQDKELLAMWKKEFSDQIKRLKECRQLLRDNLKKIDAKGNWDSLTLHCGMFVLLPLTENQIVQLKSKHKIFLISDGRINVSAINRNDMEKVAKAIKEVMEIEGSQ